MAYMWPQSLTPWLDPCGDPYAGAKAYFFASGTTTPRTTYVDSEQSTPHDHPVLANGSGRFPAIFMSGADYRVRIETASGVVIEDVDGISIPVLDDTGGGGDTPTEELVQTGDYIFAHRAGAMTGRVRANGRTIGNESSGATERANADCEALFTHLWQQDSNLAVSGGRGASAASDWASNKTIVLPDMRNRGPFGLGDMGSSNAARIPDSLLDETNITLGATGGDGEVALTTAQMPAHGHTGTAQSAGAHTHTTPGAGAGSLGSGSRFTRTDDNANLANISTTSAGAHTHPLSINNTGDGEAHSNLPPALLGTWYLKL